MKKYFLLILIYLLPFITFAQTGGVRTLLTRFASILNNLLLPLMAAIALLVFFWGLAMFLFQAGNSKRYDEGKKMMVWGIIALFVMVSVWGIVRLFQSTLGINPNSVLQYNNSRIQR